MLESKKKSQEYWHALVEPEEGCYSALFLQEWQVRLEEKGIIVIAYQAVSALLVSIGHDAIFAPPYLVVNAFPRRLHFSEKVLLRLMSGPILSGEPSLVPSMDAIFGVLFPV